MERALRPWPPHGPAQVASTWKSLGKLMDGGPVDDADVAAGEELIRWHCLGPLAYSAGAERFRGDYAANLIDAEARAELAGETVAALAGEGVEVALIKGISYAGELYPDPAHRPMGDIDLLVRPGDRDRARRILEGRGFQDRTKGGRTPMHHAWQLIRDGRSIDLHRNIVQPWRSRIDLDEVWSRARPASEMPGSVRLDAVDQLLFHWAHMARHELWVALISYVDSARLWARLDPGQRATAWARARRYQLLRSSRAALAMTRALADGAIAAELGIWSRALPSCEEVVVGKPPARSVQLVRKAVLNDSLAQLARLAAVFASRRARAWWDRRS